VTFHPVEREYRQTELGLEVKCSCCGEFWPADKEFFFFHDGKPHSWCKACYRANPKVAAKDARWRDAQRKNPPRPPKPPFEFLPLQEAMRSMPC
jgi:hypothetical protein